MRLVAGGGGGGGGWLKTSRWRRASHNSLYLQCKGQGARAHPAENTADRLRPRTAAGRAAPAPFTGSPTDRPWCLKCFPSKDIQGKVVPTSYIDDDAPAALCSTHVRSISQARLRHKAGRFPAEVPLKPATRGQNGWAVLCRPAGSAPASSTAAPEPADFLDHFDARKAFSLRAGDPGAGARAGDAGQAASTETTRGHRQRRWPSPCKGYGKGPAVNGELAFVLVNKGADRLAPRFSSGAVPKANVSGAVSRGDLEMAQCMGWSRVETPVRSILQTLAKPFQNLDFAVNVAL